MEKSAFGKRLGAFGLGLFIAAAAIGDTSPLTVSDGQVTITGSSSTTLGFSVARGGDLGYDAVVDYQTVDGTAVAGTDYTASSGQLRIPANSSTAVVPVTVAGSNQNAADKNFTLKLIDAAGIAPTPAFLAKSTVPLSNSVTSTVSADFNGDGKMDLAKVGSDTAGTVAVLLDTTAPGATTPSFAAPVSFAGGGKSFSLTAADINDDGKPDLIVANYDAKSISVLINTTQPGAGAPTFAAFQSFAIAASGGQRIVAAADINGDGKPDVVITDDATAVSVLLNTTAAASTTASFGPEQQFAASSAYFVDSGDLDGDGKVDLVVGNAAANSISVLLNTTATGAGSASFANAQTFATGSSPFRIIALDLNGDGRLDLASADGNSGDVSVLLNTTPAGSAALSFGSPRAFAVPGAGSPFEIAAADFNGDGKPDLAVARFSFGDSSGNNSVSILLNTTAAGAATPAFAPAQSSATGGNPVSVIARDFNGDGRPDLAVANFEDKTFSILINSTATSAAQPSFLLAASPDVGGTPFAVATADFNGDGKPDVVTTNAGANTVSFLFNTTPPGAGSALFASAGSANVDGGPLAVITGDFNGDGKTDVAVANAFDNSVSILINGTAPGATAASFTASPEPDVGSTPQSIVAGDFNGDGLLDLATANTGDDTVSVLINTAAPGSSMATFVVATIANAGNGPRAVAVGDFNGDGKPDLVVANGGDSMVTVLLNTTLAGATMATFSVAASLDVGASDFIAVGDFNGDGKPDFAVSSFGGSTVSILLNTTPTSADTTAATFTLAGTTSNGIHPFAADFDGDGRLDLAVVNSNNSVSVLLNTTTPSAGTDSASFTLATSPGVNSSPRFVVAGDFDGDGKPDLLTANGGDTTVSVLLNTQYRATVTPASVTGTIHYNVSTPTASFSTNTVNFPGTTVVSEASGSPQIVTLTNTGTADLAITSLSIVGDEAADFSESDNCPRPLPATAGSNSCTITLGFTPGAAGTRAAALTLVSNAASSPDTVSVSGTGVARAPAITASGNFDFGSQPVGSTSTASTITIRNTGNVALTDFAANLSGPDVGDFAVAAFGCNSTLAVGAECQIALQFTPTAPGSRSAGIAITARDDIDGGASTSVSGTLTGVGTQANANLSPTSLDFGNQLINTSATQAVMLGNSGNDTLTITMISTTGAPYSQTNNCGATLAPGGQCEIDVSFMPTANGSASGSLMVMSSTPGGTSSTTLSGTGINDAPSSYSFTAVTGADPSSTQMSNVITVSGTNVTSAISIVAPGAYRINTGAYTTDDGTVQPGDQVQVQLVASSAFSMTDSTTLTIGGVRSSFDVTTRAGDAMPDAFTFTAVNNVQPGTAVQSSSITVSGAEVPLAVSVDIGQYSVNGDAYTSAPGMVANGDVIVLQQTASPNLGTSTTETLTLGSGTDAVSGSFTVSTTPAQTMPNAFGFGTRDNVQPGLAQTSNPTTVGGTNTDSPISVTGGQYSIDGGPFTDAAGTVSPGASVAVQVIASSQFSTAATVTLTIGGVDGSFMVTTIAADTSPDAYSFNPVTDVQPGAVQISNPITVTGINTSSPVSVSGGSYSITPAGSDTAGPYTTEAGTVNAGDQVTLLQTASTNFSTTTTTTLSIGSDGSAVTGSFAVTTTAAQTDPAAFTFGGVTGVAPASTQTSGSDRLDGINTSSPVSVVGGSYSVNNGPFVSEAGSVNPGDSVAVQGTASSDFSTMTQVTLTVGTTQGSFAITTQAADAMPDSFGFDGISGVNPATLQTSNPITVTGINTASPISITDGQYRINDGAYTDQPGTVSVNDQVTVQSTSSTAYSTTTQAVLDIGGATAAFTVTTRDASTTAAPFSFTPVTDAAPGSVQTSDSVTIGGIETAVPVSVSGGQYSLNQGPYTSADGMIQPGDSVTLQTTASTESGGVVQAVLNVNGTSGTFQVTTRVATGSTSGGTTGGSTGSTTGGTTGDTTGGTTGGSTGSTTGGTTGGMTGGTTGGLTGGSTGGTTGTTTGGSTGGTTGGSTGGTTGSTIGTTTGGAPVGTAGVLISPNPLDFGDLVLSEGSQSSPLAIAIRNYGTAPLTLRSITVNGNFVELGSSCPAALAAGQSCEVSIALVARGNDHDYVGNLAVDTDIGISSAALSGRVVAPVNRGGAFGPWTLLALLPMLWLRRRRNAAAKPATRLK